ncbi:NADP-dependent isocitrate dehydrogenase [Candidatus Methylacidithermus pantelleriae]|uniref:Isocitrate dehydrogenase [NADP] n=1 Tax=Candidatus Methylacidithermus pantelleriae TaxID=2744239 RepID=A0A8J2BP33_9BACT|nr:NADP-dependent isocitrate dehydrogenase [Candidatus Methylacidithermus pantelleriae]CAF0698165.1 Isocitrate dehydrogenase [Candidatus Methylacidithermus pantelleriae]
MARTPITVAFGDGIGPEIMSATLTMIEAAGAQLEMETIEIGQKLYEAGYPSGIDERAWESLHRTRVFLKAPITTPQGGGYKSLNVTIRKALGLYANIRPAVAYHPVIETLHPGMDIVIIRENEEDLYAGIEYRQSIDQYEAIKLATHPGSERIVRFAFEYAQAYGRKKVTCFTKDNILKMTDGLFHRLFEEVAAEYPAIQKEHWIVDIGSAKLAFRPQEFDVVVIPNLYGDILSDIMAQLAGSVGLAGSANIGASYAMFEAVHGSAPRRAGQDVANPSGLFLAAVQMLVYLGQTEAAERAHNAWLRTLEEGIHTRDIFREGKSRKLVGTQEFAREVARRMGQEPQSLLRPVRYPQGVPRPRADFPYLRKEQPKELVGIDLFLENSPTSPESLAERLQSLAGPELSLQCVANRGLVVWPTRQTQALRVDNYQARFLWRASCGTPPTQEKGLELARKCMEAGLGIVRVQWLYRYGNEPGYSQLQGE